MSSFDLTGEKVEAFRAAVAELFRKSFLGDYCRVGDYADADEINLVVSHGSTVSTMPVVEGQQERVISVRQIAHAVLRYSENTGMLRLARIRKAHQPEIAELFASIILERPGFFEGDDAQDLYTLRPGRTGWTVLRIRPPTRSGGSTRCRSSRPQPI